ncbi:MAG: ACP phosphodiesterase [Lysobacterales bacterium]
MNYLAHAVLSGNDPQWQLGGYLGDHVRGRRWETYPQSIARGILLHRKIDVFTDGHPVFARARERLDPSYRRYSGILLDIFFDHFLARSFADLTGRNLGLFAGVTYTNLRAHWHLLPRSLQRFSRYQQQHNLLVNYADDECIHMVLQAVSGRVRRENPLASGLTELKAHRSELNNDFHELFADLRGFAADNRQRLASEALSAYRPIDKQD